MKKLPTAYEILTKMGACPRGMRNINRTDSMYKVWNSYRDTNDLDWFYVTLDDMCGTELWYKFDAILCTISYGTDMNVTKTKDRIIREMKKDIPWSVVKETLFLYLERHEEYAKARQSCYAV
jgi:hypothetical protein